VGASLEICSFTVLGVLKKFRENSVDDRREGYSLLPCNALQFRQLTIGDERHKTVASCFLGVQARSAESYSFRA